jgi:nitrate reductase assembly molybdenum cofactor insertion protein NarJ
MLLEQVRRQKFPSQEEINDEKARKTLSSWLNYFDKGGYSKKLKLNERVASEMVHGEKQEKKQELLLLLTEYKNMLANAGTKINLEEAEKRLHNALHALFVASVKGQLLAESRFQSNTAKVINQLIEEEFKWIGESFNYDYVKKQQLQVIKQEQATKRSTANKQVSNAAPEVKMANQPLIKESFFAPQKDSLADKLKREMNSLDEKLKKIGNMVPEVYKDTTLGWRAQTIKDTNILDNAEKLLLALTKDIKNLPILLGKEEKLQDIQKKLNSEPMEAFNNLYETIKELERKYVALKEKNNTNAQSRKQELNTIADIANLLHKEVQTFKTNNKGWLAISSNKEQQSIIKLINKLELYIKLHENFENDADMKLIALHGFSPIKLRGKLDKFRNNFDVLQKRIEQNKKTWQGEVQILLGEAQTLFNCSQDPKIKIQLNTIIGELNKIGEPPLNGSRQLLNDLTTEINKVQQIASAPKVPTETLYKKKKERINLPWAFNAFSLVLSILAILFFIISWILLIIASLSVFFISCSPVSNIGRTLIFCSTLA